MSKSLYEQIIKLWLTGFLLFLPFQSLIVKNIASWSNELAKLIKSMDEITVVLFFSLAIIRLYRNKEIFDKLYIILLLPVLFLSITGTISGFLNGNPLFITILGIFEYIKYFFVIFIYAAFFRDFGDFKKIFRLLLIITIFLGIVAFIQEFWAMFSRYIIGKDITDRGIYLLRDIPIKRLSIVDNFWRFGIYRAWFILHPNMLGFYSLLILNLYIFTVRKMNLAVIAALLSGVLVSLSRMIYSGFVFLLGAYIFKRKKWIGILAILVIVVLFIFTYFSTNELLNKIEKLHGRDVITFREYVGDKAIEIWKDYPFWGRGPGMFGGVISVIYNSPIYDEYNFLPNVKIFIKVLRSIDQFWPHVLVELGIIGTAIMAGIFISLVIVIIIAKQRTKSKELKGLFTGLLTFIIIILIYTLGGGINSITAFTYYAFIGMGIGCVEKK